ncbi:arsenate reductase (glutaredoxin) [Halobacteriovorax sp. HLS]|uniref:arsenate reductase (glutaredoxin) n=1 Tax=Halobacteriovorax sp. HLS TaxID=2234000 RepID=UPI000FDC4617|nr:arsenate reductase (glutaredoxin) [Halobacteriovorax sp. HLS]
MIYYHNPRCSKSRQGLELLNTKGVDFEIKEYLKEGLAQKEVSSIIKDLGINPLQGLIRVKEATFKELGLSKNDELSNTKWAKIISENPVLLERPILVNGSKVAIGRPPEDLLKAL